jgi:tripartite-type tricarboxylate transporter receptor subunit TctC
MLSKIFPCLFALLAALAPTPARAQEYPAKPVRLIIPWVPGGTTDLIGRVLAQRFSESTGQQWIVDNRGGATGTLGHALAAKAVPDGYTLLFGTNSTFGIAPQLYKTLPYDNEKAFATISFVAVAPQLLAVHPSLPARTVKDLVALARARPGQILYATAGVGATSHMAAELFMNLTGIRMIHVPYKGGGLSSQALISGETAVSFVQIDTALPHVRSGRIRPLGTSAARRSSLMPELPTISEAGVPGFEMATSYGMFGPAGTPREVIAYVHREIVKALAAPEVKEKLRAQGIDPVGGGPEDLATHQRQESAKWARVVKEQGIKFE